MTGTATKRSREEPRAATRRARDFAPEEWLPLVDDARQRTRSLRSAERWVHQLFPGALDFVLVCLGGGIAFWMRFGMGSSAVANGSAAELWRAAWSVRYPAVVGLYGGLVVLSCISLELYRPGNERDVWSVSLDTVKAIALATSLLVLFIFAFGDKEISRLVVAFTAAWNCGALTGWRYGKRWRDARKAQRGEGVSRVLIVGAGKVGRALASWLEANQQLGYHVCGFLDAHARGDARVLGSLRDLRKVALAQFADQLLLTSSADRETVEELLLEARNLHLNFSVVPNLYDGLGWRAPVGNIGGFPVLQLHGEPIPVLGLAMKRAMDIFGAALLLLFSAPLLAVAAAWIHCDSRGPVLYSAVRIGRKGRRFRCYKLRTMIAQADAQKEALRQSNERNGPFFKIENDPRVTRCGRWLRKYSIDEVPQLVNVLMGDMSLIGPRPHPVDDFERYSIEHLRRLDVKPGVTGLWQVTARRDPSFDTNMVLDLEYIENWSLRLDWQILCKTISVVLAGDGQ